MNFFIIKICLKVFSFLEVKAFYCNEVQWWTSKESYMILYRLLHESWVVELPLPYVCMIVLSFVSFLRIIFSCDSFPLLAYWKIFYGFNTEFLTSPLSKQPSYASSKLVTMNALWRNWVLVIYVIKASYWLDNFWTFRMLSFKSWL